jgi:PAS domain S-box-containing protein
MLQDERVLAQTILAAQSDVEEAVLVGEPERIYYANDAACRMLGYERSDMLALDDPLTIIAPEHRGAIADAIRRQLAGEEVPNRHIIELMPRDGKRLTVEMLWKLADRERRLFVALMRDLTERRLAEATMAQFAALFASSPVAMVVKTLDGIIRHWNPAAAHLYGYTAEEAVGRHASFLAPPDRRGEIDAYLRELRQGGAIKEYETVRLAKDGRLVEVSLNLSPVRDEKGELVAVATVVQDLTRAKLAEAPRVDLERREAASRAAEAERRRFRILAELGRRLAGTTDYRHRFQEAAEVLVPHLGDWAEVYRVKLDGRLERVAAASHNVEPSQAPLPASQLDAPGIAGLLDEERPRLVRILEPDSTDGASNRRTALLVPLVARGHRLGILALTMRPGRRHESADIALAHEAGRQTAVALDNALLYAQSREAQANAEAALEQRDLTLRGLQHHHRLLLAIVEGAGDLIYLKDRAGRFLLVNSAFGRAVDRAPAEVAGRTEAELDGPLVQALRQHDEEVVNERRTVTFEARIPLADGVRVLLTTKAPHLDAAGGVVGIVGIARDITHRKDAEDRVAAGARMQAIVAELGREALGGVALAEMFDRAVRRVAQTLDVEYCKVLELLPDRTALRLVSGVGWQEGLVGHATVGAGLDSQAGYTLASSAPVVVTDLRTETRFHGPPLLFEHGVVSGLSVIIQGSTDAYGVLGAHTRRRRGFTPDEVNFLQAVANVLGATIQRRRAERSLRASEARVRSVVASLPIALFAVDGTGQVILCEGSGLQLLGLAPGSAVGRALDEVPEVAPALVDQVQRALGGQAVHETLQAGGRVFDLRYGAFPGLDGGADGVIAVATDVTDHRRAEAMANHLAALVASTDDAVIGLDLQGRIQSWNASAERIFGTSGPEVLGHPIRELTDTNIDLSTLLQRIQEGEAVQRFPARRHRSDGSAVEISATLSPVRDATGNVVGASIIARDVTEALRAERRRLTQFQVTKLLAESRTVDEGSHELLESLTSGLGWDLALLWTAETEDGPLRLRDAWPPSGFQRFVEASRALSFGPGETAVGIVWSTGRPVWLRDAARERRFRRADGASEGLRACVMIPIAGSRRVYGVLELYAQEARKLDDEQLRYATGFGTQIGLFIERQGALAEVQRLNQELEQRVTQRTSELEMANRELEAFSYSVSHDLRAPLRTIDGFSKAVLEDYGPRMEEDGRALLQRVRAATQRMAQLIDDLLRLSRITRSELRHETVDLTAVAEGIAVQLRAQEPSRRVEVSIAEGLRAEGDPDLLWVALENLLRNAWKFTRDRDPGRIEVGTAELEGQQVYYVRDNGAGFDMTYRQKLFLPFQRLHTPAEFEGSGIGLATVHRIIRRHGGQVWAEAEVDRGATFYFTVPHAVSPNPPR